MSFWKLIESSVIFWKFVKVIVNFWKFTVNLWNYSIIILKFIVFFDNSWKCRVNFWKSTVHVWKFSSTRPVSIHSWSIIVDVRCENGSSNFWGEFGENLWNFGNVACNVFRSDSPSAKLNTPSRVGGFLKSRGRLIQFWDHTSTAYILAPALVMCVYQFLFMLFGSSG